LKKAGRISKSFLYTPLQIGGWEGGVFLGNLTALLPIRSKNIFSNIILFVFKKKAIFTTKKIQMLLL